MKLMLGVILLCLLIGLIAPRIGRREVTMVVVIMTVMAGLYYRFGERFM
jgi:hypothetical protein